MKTRLSNLFTSTRRESPADEESRNADLLIRAGYIDKLMAGVYSQLPLGLEVLRNIEKIIREEMASVGGQEVLMPSLQPKENWLKTGRWDTVDILYKVKDASDREFALGPTHEEVVVPLMQQFAQSYKAFPTSVYQIQTKFRMELRPKAGLLRGREFQMKDMYSFHLDAEDFSAYYEKVKGAYQRIFERVGIGEKTLETFASGGDFSQYSHEYQTITSSGEDTIYICESCNIAINKEIIADAKNVCAQCGSTKLQEARSIEVGNIFELKTKFTEAFNYSVTNDQGNNVPVLMGCYGIGLTRLMGTVVEVLSDDAGIVWPKELAPAPVVIVELKDGLGQKLFDALPSALYDDRKVSAGVKFADADLMGLPYRAVVSEKTNERGVVEIKNRTTGEVTEKTFDGAVSLLSS
ncbi:MAG: aminoacyl--tRNA ligase-related protein [bacterium]|nr:aminoacyl--tRNA ligase-related protein [bacterium]